MVLIHYRKMLFDEGGGKCAVCFGENKNICVSAIRIRRVSAKYKKGPIFVFAKKNIVFT